MEFGTWSELCLYSARVVPPLNKTVLDGRVLCCNYLLCDNKFGKDALITHSDGTSLPNNNNTLHVPVFQTADEATLPLFVCRYGPWARARQNLSSCLRFCWLGMLQWTSADEATLPLFVCRYRPWAWQNLSSCWLGYATRAVVPNFCLRTNATPTLGLTRI